MWKEELRKFLIDHLEKSIVPYKNWWNRDTPSAQESQAKMRMYLLAWCDFKIMGDYDLEVPEKEIESYLKDENIKTMYISIFHYEFEDEWSWDTHYSPHPKYLEDCIKDWNRDWY